jgi:mannan endo-1,4-beta-mannosidase
MKLCNLYVVMILAALSACVFRDRGSLSAGEPLPPISPANPHASADAVSVLRYLHGLPELEKKRVLSGQNVGHANQSVAEGYAKYFEDLGQKTGRYPAILGVCYGSEEIVPAKIAEANKMLIRHWRDGGLVTISMSPRNPWTGKGLRDRTLGAFDYLDMIRPGTEPNRKWSAVLREVADGLTELRDAGVVVLWRPLHEMNGDFFWWSAGKHQGWASSQEFTAVWKDMFAYLTVERKLDNLLWVYAPNNASPGVQPVTCYYPGDPYVDVVGLDYYGNTMADATLRRDYVSLTALGKPFGFSEVGPAFWYKAHPRGNFDDTSVIRSIREEYPRATFFVFWQGWSSLLLNVKMGIVENQNAVDLLNDPWVITRDSVQWR